MKIHLLTETEYRCISSMYATIYPNHAIQSVSRSCWKFTEILLNGDTIGSQSSRSYQSSYILAYWCGSDGIIQPYDSTGVDPRPGRILFYVKHSITVNNRVYEHILACVEWFLCTPEVIQR